MWSSAAGAHLLQLLPCDWLIINLCYQATEQVYLIKWPLSVSHMAYVYELIIGTRCGPREESECDIVCGVLSAVISSIVP